MKYGGFGIVVVAALAFILLSAAGNSLKGSEGTESGYGENSAMPLSTFQNSFLERTTRMGRNFVRRSWWSRRIHGPDEPDYYVQTWPKFEFGWPLVIGTLIGMLGSALGSVGGVGGAGFYLPMLSFVLGFDAKTSAALSKAMVMGAAVTSVVFNLREKHPTEAKPVIDYDFAMLFQPMILLGISIGVILNVLLPEWLVTLFLIILFSKIAWSSFKRATILAEQERKTLDSRRSSTKSLQRADPPDSDENGDYFQIGSDNYASRGLGDDVHQEAVSWTWFPIGKMVVLTITWLIFLALQVVKVYVQDCSLWYWLATALQVPVAFGVTIREAFHQDKVERPDYDDKEEGHASNDETDIKGDWLRKLIFSALGLVAGIVGGLLGVGGGGIMGPAFLELGLSPQVSSATASFIMVFSSSLSVAEFYLLGRLPGNFAIYLTFIAMVASIWGQVVVKKIIQASGRTSIIVFIIVGCILAAAIVLGILGIDRSYVQWKTGENMGFQDMCVQ